MATAIPDHWDTANPHTWTLSTVIDAYSPDNPLRQIWTLTDHATCFGVDPLTLAPGDPERAARLWADMLQPIHDLAVALAYATPDREHAAVERLTAANDPAVALLLWHADDPDDVETESAWSRRALAALTVE